jgi:hypothetical protein
MSYLIDHDYNDADGKLVVATYPVGRTGPVVVRPVFWRPTTLVHAVPDVLVRLQLQPQHVRPADELVHRLRERQLDRAGEASATDWHKNSTGVIGGSG